MIDFRELVASRFSVLKEEDLAQIMPLITFKVLKAGELFIQEGDMSYQIAIVLEGLLRNFHYTEDGEEKTVLFTWEAEVVAGYKCIFINEPATENIEALEPTTLVVFDYQAFKALTHENTRFVQAHLQILEKAFVEAILRIDDFTLNSPEERYLRLLTERPFLLQRVQQKHLASFLGITQVSLSRIRKRITQKKKHS
jgi:CRP-like cAMP-binding protein